VPPSQDDVTEAATGIYGEPVQLTPGLLTHLTRLTRLCTPFYRDSAAIAVPNDADALPSTGGSLRALELACEWESPF
jgi:hypothetical protein